MSIHLDSPTGDANRDPGYARAEVIEFPDRWATVGSPWSLVQDRFTVTSGYAETSYNATQGFISDVLNLVNELERFNIPDIDVDSPEVPSLDYASRPTMGVLDIDQQWPANTAEKPVLDQIPAITPVEIPPFNIPSPDIFMPERPIDREVSSPGDAPVTGDVPIPARPGYWR